MISCWLYKWRLTRSLDENCEIGPRVLQHLQSCRPCSEWKSMHTGIAQRLQGEVKLQKEVPPFLHARIVARLGAETLQPQEIGSWLPWASAISLATLVVLAVFIWHRPSNPRPASVIALVEQTELQEVSLPLRLPNSSMLAEFSRNWDQPLETEMKSVVHDARAAVNLLAFNFLPDTLLASRSSLSIEPP